MSNWHSLTWNVIICEYSFRLFASSYAQVVHVLPVRCLVQNCIMHSIFSFVGRSLTTLSLHAVNSGLYTTLRLVVARLHFEWLINFQCQFSSLAAVRWAKEMCHELIVAFINFGDQITCMLSMVLACSCWLIFKKYDHFYKLGTRYRLYW